MKRFLMVCVMVLCVALIVIANTSNAYAASGTYDGISWDLTGGVLTLGREGEPIGLTGSRPGFVRPEFDFVSLVDDRIEFRCSWSRQGNSILFLFATH